MLSRYLITLEIEATSPQQAAEQALTGISAELLPDGTIDVVDADRAIDYTVEARRGTKP